MEESGESGARGGMLLCEGREREEKCCKDMACSYVKADE